MGEHNDDGPVLAGWREWASLPDFGVDAIKAKIDTGAKTSALHAKRVRQINHDGYDCVEFFLQPRQHESKPQVFCVAPLLDRRVIRSSNGDEEERFVVEARLRLGDREFLTPVSLADRRHMEFRLLIGRDALRGRFTVDPEGSFLLTAKAAALIEET